MADALAETIAAVALAGAIIAVLVGWFEWVRLRSAREQLTLLAHLAHEQGEKVERLGSLVAALRATVETKVQKLQISALERQIEMSTAALKTQDAPPDVPRIRSIPGASISAASMRQVPFGGETAQTGAIGRFRLWAGWGRTARGRELGKGPPRNPEP